MAVRYDRQVIQVAPVKEVDREYQRRVNESLRLLSSMITRLEGRQGEQTIKEKLTLLSEGYTFIDFESSAGGKASLSATGGTTRTFALAKGARRDPDKQWIATDTGAIILELRDDGTIRMYADTSLTVGAAFNPTLSFTFPTDSAPHGLVSATHTASGLTPGHLLVATATNSFGFAAASPTTPTTHGLVSTYHSVTGLTTGHVLTATGTNTFDFSANAAVPTTRTLTAGSGLSGGGDLSANRQFDIDLTELTALTAAPDQDADFLLAYDASAAANKKVTPQYLSGNQPHSILYSSGQANSSTSETEMTSYGWTCPAGNLEVGDTLLIIGDILTQTTAGTKVGKLYIGTSAAATIFSHTGTTANTHCYFVLHAIVRSTTSIAVQGITVISAANATVTTTHFVNAGLTVADISANAQLVKFTLQGPATNDLKMIDLSIKVFRAGGTYSTV